MNVDARYAKHDAFFWEFMKASGYNQIYNDQQIAAIIDSMQTTRMNLEKFQETMPFEIFVEIQIAMMCTMVSFESTHEKKYKVLRLMNKMRKRIEDSIAKPPST